MKKLSASDSPAFMDNLKGPKRFLKTWQFELAKIRAGDTTRFSKSYTPKERINYILNMCKINRDELRESK